MKLLYILVVFLFLPLCLRCSGDDELFSADVLQRYEREALTVERAKQFVLIELKKIEALNQGAGAATEISTLYSIYTCNPDLEKGFVKNEGDLLDLDRTLKRLLSKYPLGSHEQKIVDLWRNGIVKNRGVEVQKEK